MENHVIMSRNPTVTPYSHQQRPKSMDRDKAKGIIYGLAIGDALGRLTEFKSLPQIKSENRIKGITDLPESALYTDDTQISLAIAEALVRIGKQGIESIMVTIKDEFIFFSLH